MAWTNIPDDVLEPGKPIRSVDAIALRDNPIAIAQGLPGAPRIAAAALQTGTPERDWVLNRAAGADVGAVGTYAMLSRGLGANGSTNPGATLAGSNLRYAGGLAGIQFSLQGIENQTAISATNPPGTWRCMGFERSFSGNSQTPTAGMTWASLWLRIS